jgi:hypothetical protein
VLRAPLHDQTADYRSGIVIIALHLVLRLELPLHVVLTDVSYTLLHMVE